MLCLLRLENQYRLILEVCIRFDFPFSVTWVETFVDYLVNLYYMWTLNKKSMAIYRTHQSG